MYRGRLCPMSSACHSRFGICSGNLHGIMSDTARRNKRIMTAIVGVLGATVISCPLGVLLIPGGSSRIVKLRRRAPTTTKPPEHQAAAGASGSHGVVIKPRIARRPSARRRICRFGSATSPGPFAEPFPESMRIQLTDVDSFKNPLNGNQTVKFAMTNESLEKFFRHTAEHVSQQTAFVRAGDRGLGAQDPRTDQGTVLQTHRRSHAGAVEAGREDAPRQRLMWPDPTVRARPGFLRHRTDTPDVSLRT